MSESARQGCPQCGLVYRIKKNVPGKVRLCRQCGVALRPIEDAEEIAPIAAEPTAADSAGAASTVPAGEAVPVNSATASPAGGLEADLAAANRAASRAAQEAIPKQPPASQSSRRIVPGGMTGKAVSPSGALENDLAVINKMASASVENIVTDEPARSPEPPAATAGTGEKPDAGAERRLLETANRFEEEMRRLASEQEGRFRKLEANILRLLEREDAESLSVLTEKLRETGDVILARLDECRTDCEWKQAARTPAPTPALDADALVRAMDELAREQSAGAARMEALSAEIRAAVEGLSGIGEWRNEFPDRVADEIGRTVEARMVGPIAGALARQAPVILAELQDNKLVDIVSRAVREAQRPLVREILSSGRGGVPLWLFASIMLPLLLILGYLFLPVDEGSGERDATLRSVAASLSHLENEGAPLSGDAEERLANIEAALANLHGEALNHAKNAATLEEQTRNLAARLEEKETLINEYRDTLQRQVRLLNAYRTRLTQLGVPPESVRE